MKISSVNPTIGDLEAVQKYCHAVFKGNGDDVASEVFLIALERRYEEITVALLQCLSREAARRLKISRTSFAEDGIVLLPPLKRHKPVCACGCGAIAESMTLGWGICAAGGERVDISPPAAKMPVPPRRTARKNEAQIALFAEVAE